MQRFLKRAALLGALLLAPSAALAAPIGIDGCDPVITFGFNPQPEPPPEFGFTLSPEINPFDVVSKVSGVSPTPFQLFLDVSEGTLVPPDTIVPSGGMFEVLLRAGAETLVREFSLFVPNGWPLRAEVNS